MTTRLEGDVFVEGNLTVGGNPPQIPRSSMQAEAASPMGLPVHLWKVWDALEDNLPSPAANDDLTIYTGTAGTDFPDLRSEDLKTAGATDKKAAILVSLPPEYRAGEDVSIRAKAKMSTAQADTSATLDFSVYEYSDPTTDLVATAAQDMNSTTAAELTYTITSTGLAPGDRLLIVMTAAVNDNASGSTVQAVIEWVDLLVDIRG